MTRGRHLTNQQRSELLALYLEKGYAAAAPLATQYGILPKEVSRIARKANLPPKPKKLRPIDKRWQWAVERGAVLA